MRPVYAIPRVLVVVGLIAGPGFAWTYHCRSEVSQVSAIRAEGGSHTCPCTTKKGACCCRVKCLCGGPLPQQSRDPAVPARSNDSVQLLVLAPNEDVVGGPVGSPYSFDCCSASLTGFATNLIAQGTRLNI